MRWTLKPDQDKPNLDVIWTPPKGTKVKAGDKITAKLTARDDATAAQTGIARLRVDIGVGGGLVAAPAQYSSPVPLQECGRENPVRIYEATYTVPADPPPVVKLRANARDFAGNETWDDAEFPTSDWHGTISISYTWDEEGANGVITSTANLRLRETREQPITDLKGRVIGSKTTLVHTASSISENYAGVAGTAGGNPGVACEGSGPAELSGEAGTIWLNSSGRDATGVVGFSFPAEGTYFIDLNTAVGSQRYRVRCANGATHKSAFTAPPIGMGVQEDPGRKIEDRGARMRGSYRGNWNAGQNSSDLGLVQVTWGLRGSPTWCARIPFYQHPPSKSRPPKQQPLLRLPRIDLDVIRPPRQLTASHQANSGSS